MAAEIRSCGFPSASFAIGVVHERLLYFFSRCLNVQMCARYRYSIQVDGFEGNEYHYENTLLTSQFAHGSALR